MSIAIALRVMEMVSGCCRILDTLLQRFDVQQHIVAVMPSLVPSWQPFVPPRHEKVAEFAIRSTTV